VSAVRAQRSVIPPEVTTRVVNALIGAVNDPEPTVRAVAVRSLGAIGDRRATMAIVSRLRDDARAVRVGAADALLWMGVSTLPGVAGERLTEAQNEYVRSLAAFPDVPGNHATRGWLESERGRQTEAARALDLALSLDPSSPRAHVYRGVVYARTGAIEEAVRHWRIARSLDPAYPNIDRLLEEGGRQLRR
jgi:Flp pilus assembly protein TadD